jgi:hypothetical protein
MEIILLGSGDMVPTLAPSFPNAFTIFGRGNTTYINKLQGIH